jgi:hypothetical protein
MNGNVLAWTLGTFSALAAALQGQGRILTIDDFEDGDRRAASGLSWISIADDLTGGASTADLAVAPAAGGAGRTLRVTGQVAAADGYAGAWVGLDGRGRAVDVSDFAGLRLRVRGSGPVRVGLRGGSQSGVNYWAPVEGDGRQVDIAFESLKAMRPEAPPFDPRSVRWLGLAPVSGRAGPFEFEVEEIALYSPRPDARLRVREGPPFAVAFRPGRADELPPGPWKDLARDAAGDGKQKRLPDATAVAVFMDPAGERAWFRVALAGTVPTRWLGVNLALDVDGDPANGMAWWGTNTSFRFDRLVTVYGWDTGMGYDGIIGMADAAQVQGGDMGGAAAGDVVFIPDRSADALVVGIPARALGAGAGAVRLVAAVGSAMQHNDDVPDEGAAVLAR